eukprot:scaffold74922_cov75-Phaeocystis_antarctica.AAC.3
MRPSKLWPSRDGKAVHGGARRSARYCHQGIATRTRTTRCRDMRAFCLRSHCRDTSTPLMHGCSKVARGPDARQVETLHPSASSARRGVSPWESCPEAELLLLQSSSRR